MTDTNTEAIPIEAFPDPVLQYTVVEDRPLVTATNESFAELFDDVSSETAITSIFDRFETVDSTGNDVPESHIARGDTVRIYLDGTDDGPFLVRIVPTDDTSGYLVFSTLRDQPNASGSVGVGQVASMISHDLRNPLDVAQAHLRAAQETGDAEHFEAVDRAHDRMMQIIQDVLTLARGDSVVDPSETISLEDTVEAAWQTVDTDRAELRVSDTLPEVTADPDRLRRLFENLFRNAVEHGSTEASSDVREDATGHNTATDSGAVIISVEALEENGFYVADDGSGIPEHERELVFEPGYTSGGSGTGLGLAIVQQIVEAHGWEISLDVSESGGARFEIRT
jgi:nitrogen fixation/metabolism regulation signal transduction histidine kinase